MSIVIGTVTINRNPNYPCDWWSERLNQSKIETADGGHLVYDNGPSLIRGTLIIRHVAKSEGDALRTYLSGTALYEKNSFVITPQASGKTNLGKGDATAITVFYDGGATLEGVFSLVAPGLYDITLPYREALA